MAFVSNAAFLVRLQPSIRLIPKSKASLTPGLLLFPTIETENETRPQLAGGAAACLGVRIIAGSIILNALAAALMVGNALPISLAALFILTFVVNAGTLVSQFVAQRDIREGTR